MGYEPRWNAPHSYRCGLVATPTDSAKDRHHAVAALVLLGLTGPEARPPGLSTCVSRCPISSRDPYSLKIGHLSRSVGVYLARMLRGAIFITLSLILSGSRSTRLGLPAHAYWNEATGRFSWERGEVTIPNGFTYQVDQGADTFEGHFTSDDGHITFRHDIGGYAGAWAKSLNERSVAGARVWTSKRAVTFPDSGCANFFFPESSIEAALVIERIATSFRPKSPIDRSSTCR